MRAYVEALRQSVPNFRLACEEIFMPALLGLGQACIFRSGDLSQLTSADVNLLCDLEIDSIIDLRSQEEAMQRQVSLSLIESKIDYQHFPLSDYNQKLREKKYPCYLDYYHYYVSIIEENSQIVTKLLKHIFSADYKRWLISCYAGKDRTGIIIMLIMETLQIPREIILTDYILSGARLIESGNFLERNWQKRNMTKDEYLQRIQPDVRTLIKLLEYFCHHYGNVRAYLNHIGIRSSLINKFHNQFSLSYKTI